MKTDITAGPIDYLVDKAKEKAEKIPAYRGLIKLFPNALLALAELSQYGGEKHHDKELKVENYNEDIYIDAVMRHLLKRAIHGEKNPEDANRLHIAQVAWDALAAAERILKNDNIK